MGSWKMVQSETGERSLGIFFPRGLEKNRYISKETEIVCGGVAFRVVENWLPSGRESQK